MLSRARDATDVDDIDVRAQFWSRRSIYNIHLLYIFTASRRAAKLITPNPVRPVRPTPSSRGGAALCHAGPAVAMAPH